MPLRQGRKKWRGLSADTVGMACQGQTQRQMYLPSSLWGTKPLGRRFGTSTMKYIYSNGCPGHQPAGLNGWKRSSRRSCLPLGAIYEDEEVLPCWRRTKGGLPWLPCGPAAEQDPTLRVLRPEGETAPLGS